MVSLATPLGAAAAAAAASSSSAARFQGSSGEAAPPSALQRYPFPCASQGLWRPRSHGFSLPATSTRHEAAKSRRTPPKLRAMDMSAGQSDGPQRLSMDAAMESLKGLWARCPEPVRSFPWTKASRHFLELILDLVLTAAKYLCIPVLLVSSLSEMSYCAHERKMLAIPVPLLCGIAVARVLEETALEISPAFKALEFPWHLLLIAGFFMLVKLPGPYYPYWGRLILPHFANGGLCNTIWSFFSWFRRSRHPISEESIKRSSDLSSTQPI